MAVQQTGSATEIESSSSSEISQPITVPADADFCVLLAGGYQGTALLAQANWDGDDDVLDFEYIYHSYYDASGQWIVGAYYFVDPPTGSQTLYLKTVTGVQEGMHYVVIFFKGVDSSDPIVDTDRQIAAGGAPWTSSLAGVGANDMGIIAVTDYETAPNVDPSGYGQTALHESVFHYTGNGVGIEAGEDALRAESTGSWLGGVAFALKAAAIAHTLEADHGSFSLSGQAASLLAGRKVSAANGSYTFSGQAAGLTAGRLLTAAHGSFALSGQAAGLRATRLLTSEAGAFSLTGQAAGLYRGLLLPGGAGAFVLTGKAADLIYSASPTAYILTAEAGGFTLTGQAAGLLRGLLLPAGAGEFVLAGQDSGLLHGYTLITEVGVFALSGQDVDLLRGYLLEIEPGVFMLTGLPATLTYSGELQQREILTWAAESTKVLSFEAISTKNISERAHSTKVIEFDAE